MVFVVGAARAWAMSGMGVGKQDAWLPEPSRTLLPPASHPFIPSAYVPEACCFLQAVACIGSQPHEPPLQLAAAHPGCLQQHAPSPSQAGPAHQLRVCHLPSSPGCTHRRQPPPSCPSSLPAPPCRTSQSTPASRTRRTRATAVTMRPACLMTCAPSACCSCPGRCRRAGLSSGTQHQRQGGARLSLSLMRHTLWLGALKPAVVGRKVGRQVATQTSAERSLLLPACLGCLPINPAPTCLQARLPGRVFPRTARAAGPRLLCHR